MTILSTIIDSIIMGILLGGVYITMGIGLSLIFGVMRMVNLSYGDFIVLSSYLSSVFLFNYSLDPILSLSITFPTLFIVGFVIYRFLIYKSFRISMEAPMLITFGLSIILQNLFLLVWTPMPRSLITSYIIHSIRIGEHSLPLVYLMDLCSGLVTSLTLYFFKVHPRGVGYKGLFP